MIEMLSLEEVGKTFTLHLKGGATLPVVQNVSFSVEPGECVALSGPSGTGKSSILKMIYGNYRTDTGRIMVRCGHVVWDMALASPRRILHLRRTTVGYVSQFLRVIPRVPAIDVVAGPARDQGMSPEEARDKAAALLHHLSVPERLWSLPPATFSGGEQQRINIARGFIADLPLLLLDEPTASLDARNRDAVVALIEQKRANGIALLGIFHDDDVRERVASRTVDVTRFAAAA